MAQDVVVKIRAEDDFSATVKKINKNFEKVTRSMGANSKKAQQSMDGLGKSANLLKVGLAGIAGVLTSKFASAILKAGSEVEDLTVQFDTVLGSAAAAEKRMRELSKFAQTTPFQLKGVADASKVLETLTNGALSTGDGLRLVGDVAAATGTDFKELSVTVGRAYSGLQSNRPIGEAAARLQELGIMSGETRNQIERLQKVGKGKQAWIVLRREMEKSKGGMEKMSKTVTGLTSTIKDQLAAAIRQMLAGGVWDELREELQKTVDKFNVLLEGDFFARFGTVISNYTRIIVNMMSLTTKAFDYVKVAGVRSLNALVEKTGELIGKVPGLKGASDAIKQFTTNVKDNTEEDFGKMINSLNAIVEASATISKAFSKNFKKEDGKGGGGDKEKDKDKAPTGLPDPEQMKAQAEALAEIRRQFADLTRTEKQIELADLDEWYAQYFEIVKGNDEQVVELTELYRAKTYDINKKYLDLYFKATAENNRKIEENELRLQAKKRSYLKQGVSNLKGVLEIAGKENKKAAKAAQTIAIFETGITAAQSAVKAFNALVGLGPAGPALGAAAAVAALAFGAAQVVAIKSQKLAGGGVVEGNSSIGDKQMVSANAGEMFINRGQQTELFNILNGQNNAQAAGSNVNVTINGNVSDDNIQTIVEEIKMAQQEAAFLGV